MALKIFFSEIRYLAGVLSDSSNNFDADMIFSITGKVFHVLTAKHPKQNFRP